LTDQARTEEDEALPTGPRPGSGKRPALVFIVFLTMILPLISGVLAVVLWTAHVVGASNELLNTGGVAGMFAVYLYAPLTYVPGALLGVIGSAIYRKRRRVLVSIWVWLLLGAAGWALTGYTLHRMATG